VGKVQKRKVKKNILLNLIQAGAFDKFERRDELYSRITEEPYRVWEDVEMLTRQMTVLDLPSAKPIIDYYENKYEGYVNITLIEDIDPNVNEKEIWVRGIISDYKTRSIASKLSESLGIEKKIALFTVDDGTKRLECSVPPEIYTFSKELLNDGEPVVLKGHTYNSRLYVDGILNLTQNNDEILEKYIYTHGREKEIEDLESQPGHNNVSVIVSLNYRLSKNGNQYVQIHDQNGERLMWFGRGQAFKNLKPGKIIVWNKSDDSKPFINMEKVIS
jgi:DNA polymerase III alpha subunit